MQRHSDRKAYIAERQRQSLQWSGGRIRDGDGDVDGNNSEGNNNGRPPDRSSGDDGATFASQELHPPHPSATLLPDRSTPRSGASPRLEKEQGSPVLSLSSGPSDGKGNGKGRLVPVGEHHEGSFGVYMAHKMEKLRDQVDGAVTRLEGPEGSLFRGVVVHINGFVSTPVATLRELLVSRGGTVEAYNTSRCTHMICESLPAAKIRELRKLRHPPPVVRSAWVEDSVRARRKLPVAGYMVDGIFSQKSTLAAAFAAAPAKAPSPDVIAGRRTDGRPISTTDRSQDQALGGVRAVPSNHGSRQGGDGMVPRGHGSRHGGAGVMVPRSHDSRDGSKFRSAGPAAVSSSSQPTHRSPSAKGGVREGWEGGRLGLIFEENMPFAAASGGIGKMPHSDDHAMPHSDDHAMLPSDGHAMSPSGNHALWDHTPSLRAASSSSVRQPATTDAGAEKTSSPRSIVSQATASGEGAPSDSLLEASETHTMTEAGSGGRGTRSDNLLEGSDEAHTVIEGRGGGECGGGGCGGRATREPDGALEPPPFELPDMGAAGEAGRSTKDDPAFMKTFFQNSRLHFIGVGRAHAVKLVNAALAARAQPGGAPPVFSGKLGRGQTRVILHVDMDCFFVSVLVKNRPELREKAVAVAHNASNAKGAGSSEISSCNYKARAKGLKAGMFMMQAKKLCPELIVLRYDFDAYTEASDKMYAVFMRYAPVVMAVSCDEAFLELPEGTNPMAAATQIRRSILEDTGCPASAGASNCMLLARMATKEAKPDGQFWLPPEAATQHMGPLPVQDLPGVGWKLRRRLNEEGLNICSDLWPLSVGHLQKGLGLGDKTGQALWEACRGIDKRPVQAPPDRKSIGAEVNYGVRFDTQDQANGFVSELAGELSRRMAAEGVVGRALTLKIMKQRDGVGLPRKYLGHGICDARSKLLNLHRATGDAGTLASNALQLLKEAKVPPDKIRGIGLQMTRLAPVSAAASDASGGGGGGGRAGGGVAGGALHGWLIKPGETTTPDQRTPTKADDATLPVRGTGKEEDERTVAAARLGGDGQGGGGGGGVEPPRGPRLLSPEERKRMPPGSIGIAPDLRRKPAWTGRPSPPGPSNKPETSNKRPREENRSTPPRDALHLASHHRSGSPFRVVVDGSSAAGAGAGAGPWAGARAGGAGRPPVQSAGSAVQKKTPRLGLFSVDEATETRLTPSLRDGDAEVGPPGRGDALVEQSKHEQGVTTPGRGDAAVGESKHEEEEGVLVDTLVRGGDISPRSVVRRRRERGLLPGSSEVLSPSSPADRAAGTPASEADTPSMSQITFSQIDSTVLSALPPDLRREVMDQLEARQRERGSVRSSSSSPFLLPQARPGASSRVGQQLAAGSPAGASSGASVESSFAADHSRIRTAAVPRLEGVREGFDVTAAREGSAKPQQVSIDSLWNLRKLRDDDNNGDDEDEGREGPSAFYRESLRAMPLGLGLQYASLSENQRAQMARRYAQTTPVDGAGSATDVVVGARASDAAVAGSGSARPPSPVNLDDASDGGGESCQSSPRQHAPLAPVPFGRGGASPAVETGGARNAGGDTSAGRSLPSPSGEGLLRVSLSQIDRDVLDCLPPEVREEVLRAIASPSTRDGAAAAAAAVGTGAAAGASGSFGTVLVDMAESVPSDGEAQTYGDLVPEVSGVRGKLSPKQVSQQGGAESLGGRGRRGGGVFEAEKMETLRGALRVWVGGAVASPSQWHLELLYRYLEELVEGGRLDETATVLRCLRRLSSKADRRARGSATPTPAGGGSGWILGFGAVLEAVQELIRAQTGGATLSLIC